ncbi:MAG: response regulator [Methylobacterium frigidaeris]
MPDNPTPAAHAMFPGGGEMGARLRAYDWGTTPLGPVEGWPQSLCTAVRIMLSSRFAMWMAWGGDLTFFCNDAYRPTLGVKDAWALGSRSDAVWAEIWPDIGPRIARVLATGEATWDQGLLLFLERRGFSEETYHTFSYSPLADDAGRIVGMLCVVSEDTERVIGERRLEVLRDLGAGMAAARTVAEVGAVAQSCLGEGIPDLPFVLAYLAGDAQADPDLLLQAGTAVDRLRAPGDAAMLMRALDASGGEPVPVESLGAILPAVPRGPWDRPPSHALLVPVAGQGQDRPAGLFVAGLNPYRPLDEVYHGFIDLFVGQIATGLANANANEQERRRAEALAEIDRQKTVFFSNVSHEFRTPLTLMLGPLEEILAAPAGAGAADGRRLVEVAHRNGLRLLKLVNALLDFSRIEAGRTQAAYEPTDLAALTADLASSFRSATERAGLDLVVACPPLPEPVHVDREMWEKIVLNLISNAFKFTLQGRIGVALEQDGASARLSVSDSGVGIPARELPRLFERFHRVEGAQGRSFEGSGIGLALVQELVRIHGGSVAVESAPGHGSTFTVTLPLGSDHLPADRIRAERTLVSTATRAQAFVEEAARWLSADAGLAGDLLPAGEGAGGAPPASGRVLLADDNADMRDYVHRLLAGRGYAVTAVADGRAALAEAGVARPDLVLSDVMMPGLDGFGLLAALRRDPQLRDVPVILLSARAGEEARVEGVGAGADDYLTKPFSARELLARVETNLTLARVRRETAEVLRRVNEDLEVQVAERTRERDRMWRLSKDIMVVVDFDGTLAAVNPAWTEVLGWPADEVVGRPVLDLVHPDDRAASAAEIGRLAQGFTTLRFENRYRHRDGGDRTLSWTVAPGDGHFYAVGRDVTDQRELEDAFRQSQKMEAVGQLTGGIAHDFNNLLTGIVGSLDLLGTRLRQGRTDVAERYIGAALASANRAAALTHRLLAFARRQPLDPRPVRANALVGSLEDLVHRTIGEAIRLDTVLADDLWPTLCDPNQLESALLNLVINARDAMPEGGRLTIETCNAAIDAAAAEGRGVAPGDYVCLGVSDTGTGMSPEVATRAFDPFFTTKPIGQGTGLGLSMIYGFARQSEGQAEIDSAPGRGTTVRLYLPRFRGEAAVEAGPAAAAPTPSGRGETVLVVEDEPVVRGVILDVLDELGYRTLEAPDGSAGLRVLASDARIDLLVTDVGLPGINGRQLADRAREHRPGLKVLFITGYAEAAAVATGFLKPGMHMITKPFAVDALARKIRMVAEE